MPEECPSTPARSNNGHPESEETTNWGDGEAQWQKQFQESQSFLIADGGSGGVDPEEEAYEFPQSSSAYIRIVMLLMYSSCRFKN